MKIIAHRGASSLAPENTLESIQRAWQAGADGVEVDVRLTADQVPVLYHDTFLPWWSDVRGRVGSLSYHSLQQVDAGMGKARGYRDIRIPTLMEAVANTPDDKLIWLEIKSEPGEQMFLTWAQWARLLASRRNVHWISFDSVMLARLRQLLPDVSLWWILDAEWQGRTDFLQWAAPYLRAARPTGLDYCAHAGIPVWLQQAQQAGLQTAVWTVDSAEQASLWASHGCQYLTTNRPQDFI